MARVFRGVGVSPGVGLGRAFVLHVERLPIVPDPIPPERVEEELRRLVAARVEARRELEHIRTRVAEVLGDRYAGILDAQLLILDDPTLIEETTQRVQAGRVSAEWGLKEVVGQFRRRFDAVDDAYLRERGGDLSDVHRRLQRILRGERAGSERMPEEGPWVVVAHSLVPSDAVTLAGKGVVGLATDVGGPTSHTAILAQALSVPAVAGLHDFCLRVRRGDPIIVDGSSGEVQFLPSEEETAQADEKRRAWIAFEEQAVATARDLPPVTRDGVPIILRANIEFPSEVDAALRFGASGVGLYRSEFLYLSHSPSLPDEEIHYRTYRDIARRVAPHPAVIRTLDLGGEKYFHEVLGSEESNPVLGLRAVRLCLRRPDIFRPQLRGLLRAGVESNLSVMLPLVTTVDEIREVRRLLAEEAEHLKGEGVPARAEVPLGIMIEVPGAAMAADILARDADFLSVGSNDLIQYSLAADRGNESVSYLYQPLHPGVLRLLRHALDGGSRQGIPVSLCGEMGADVTITSLLIGLGVREFSLPPRSILSVTRAVRETDSQEGLEGVRQLLGEASPSVDGAPGVPSSRR